MEVINTKEEVDQRLEANSVPPSLPPASQDGQLSVDAYKNVQVLGHLPSGEFTRLMTAMSLWVAPDNGGCSYCHAPQRDAKGNVMKDEDGHPMADAANMQSDELYTKRVARRMLQMTMRINGNWKDHVKTTGVTCYTCHRGNPVPKSIWFDEPEMATRYQGIPRPAIASVAEGPGLSSLPHGFLRPFLASNENIRIQSTESMGSTDRSSIKQAEWTYGLMMYISDSLGVNCTYCHNSRSFGVWDASPTTRDTAWFGIRMVRELNAEYLEPLAVTLPAERHGPMGDGPKVGCKTCHQGAYKPLLGASMLADYGVLAEAKPQPEKTPVAIPAEAMQDGGAELLVGDGGSSNDGGGGSMAATAASDGGLKLPSKKSQEKGTHP
jgi:photosynthetic reaction center cytochrome c subunit